MNGQMMYKEYIESTNNMVGPYTKENIPKTSLDLRGMVAYAKANNKTVPELSDKELEPFVLNASVSELRKAKIKI